jgi:hypothetical protein
MARASGLEPDAAFGTLIQGAAWRREVAGMQAALIIIGTIGMLAAAIASMWQFIAVMRRWNGVKAPETSEERLARHDEIRRDPLFRRRERFWWSVFVLGMMMMVVGARL